MATDGIDESPQGRCHLALCRVAEEIARKRRRPLLQQGDEPAVGDRRLRHFPYREGDACTVDRCLHPEFLVRGDQWSFHRDLKPFTVFEEFPFIDPVAARPAPADAAM